MQELVNYIRKNYPNGCKHIKRCGDCPLHHFERGTLEYAVCMLLEKMDYGDITTEVQA